jgi:hypothetical protein
VSEQAVNDLYDSACELLYAGQRVRRSARCAGTQEAIPATLGCLAATLEELTQTGGEVRRRLPASDDGAGAMRSDDALRRLVDALAQAERACDAARAAVADLPSRAPECDSGH